MLVALCREYWVSDAKAKLCFQCEKSFSTFLRRHHCRFCGLVFCANCCAFVPPIEELQEMRSCATCFEEISFGLQLDMRSKEVSEAYELALKDSDESPGSFLEDQTRTLSALLGSCSLDNLKKEVYERSNDLTNFATNFLETRLAAIMREQSLNEEWYRVIITMVEQAVMTVFPSVFCRYESMDINNFIYFKHIKSSDKGLSKFVKGFVVRKQIAHKKMPKYIESPRVLIFAGKNSIFKSNTFRSMDGLLSQANEKLKIFMKQIEDLNPSVILADDTLPLFMLNQLANKQIAVLMNLPQETLEGLARATNGGILNYRLNIANVEKYVGSCKEFEYQEICSQKFVFFRDIPDSSLCASILIACESEKESAKVIAVIKELCLEYRNALLEKNIILQVKAQPYPDIFMNYHARSTELKLLRIAGINQCSKVEKVFKDFYSSEDRTLGQFLIDIAQNMDKICSVECTEPNLAHKFYYFKSDGRVLMTVYRNSESKLLIKNRETIYMSTHGKTCSCNDIRFKKVELLLWEYSVYKFINNFFVDQSSYNCDLHGNVMLFKDRRFVFTMKNVVIEIVWEYNIRFELMPQFNQHKNEHLERVKQKTFKHFHISAEEVMKLMIVASKELRDALNSLDYEDSEWEKLSLEVDTGTKEIFQAMEKLYQLKEEDFQTHLEIETYRRSLFFQCCRFKVMVDNSKGNMKRILRKSKIKGLEFVVEETEIDYPQESDTVIYARLVDGFDDTDPLISSEHFKYLQSGNLTLPLSNNNLCIPVEIYDPLSIIAYTLNSNEYYSKVAPRHDSNVKTYMQTHLISDISHHFKFSVSAYEGLDQSIATKQDYLKLYGPSYSYKVSVFFPLQFHALRLHLVGDHEKFILSIARSLTQQVQLGKSGAGFMLSHDKRFLLKNVSEKEIRMFMDFAPNYFTYVYKNLYYGMPSRLVSTIGAFRISVKNFLTKACVSKEKYYLLFENMKYHMPKDCQVYDLKGTTNQRRFVKQGESTTPMDLNFIQDMKGLPLCLTTEDKRNLDAALWNDTLFLTKQNIIDYSLLVNISCSEHKIACGIIDYFGQYNLEKAIESKAKTVVSQEMPTIVKPQLYKDRFRSIVMKQYFLSVRD